MCVYFKDIKLIFEGVVDLDVNSAIYTLMRATLPIGHSMDSNIVNGCTNRLGKSLVVQWRGISTK